MQAKAFRLILCVGFAVALGGCDRKAIPPRSLAEAIVAAAQKHPAHAPEWDSTIRSLADRYVHREQFGGVDAELGRTAKKALDAGCRDPFVHYLWVCHLSVPIGLKQEVIFPEAKAVAMELFDHHYPSYLRGSAAIEALGVAHYMDNQPSPADLKLLSDIEWKSCFGGMNNPEVPEWEARFLADGLAKLWMYSPKADREDTEAQIDAAIINRFGEGALLHYLRGARAVRRAWRTTDRGHTNAAEWTEFARQLTLARTELELAWSGDPTNVRTACYMIEICEGLELPRTQMEMWFRRALATGCDGAEACEAKLDYLGKGVLGSLADQVAFGREALAHPEYGWNAGLSLWLAHWRHDTWEQTEPNYLAQPKVWHDIEESITPYLARFPEAQNTRLHYAYHAWLARDWRVFREQFALTDPDKLDLRLIGGSSVLEKMREDFGRADPPPLKQVPPADI